MLMVQTPSFKSIEVLKSNGEVLRVDEGMKINFSTEDGESVTGILIKVSGKKAEKTKLQIVPDGCQKEEIYEVSAIAEGSLDVVL